MKLLFRRRSTSSSNSERLQSRYRAPLDSGQPGEGRKILALHSPSCGRGIRSMQVVKSPCRDRAVVRILRGRLCPAGAKILRDIWPPATTRGRRGELERRSGSLRQP
jgi:hypothetical protein